MKKFFLSLAGLFMFIGLFAQSNYDNKEAFSPQFYPYPGNEFRSASGEPGPVSYTHLDVYKRQG